MKRTVQVAVYSAVGHSKKHDNLFTFYGIWPSAQQIKINQSNCSHYFYLMVAVCFGPHMGPSSNSLVKYVSTY
jgi:hypothetical protein